MTEELTSGAAPHRIRLLERVGRTEIWLLGGLFLAGGLILVFGGIAEKVIDGDSVAFDHRILLALRQPGNLSDPIGPPWLVEAARDVTALGSYAVLGFVFFAAVAYLLMMRQRGAALWVTASVLGGMLLSNILKMTFERSRPDLVPHATEVFTSSFPSGHATLSAVVYLTLGALLASLHTSRAIKSYFLGVALFLTVVIGLSRIYLGVHYPTDVLAGWCIGAAWAALCWTVARWLQERGSMEGPDPDIRRV